VTETALQLKDQLLSLSEDDRLALLEVLHDSLPEESEAGADEAWEAELNRRMEEIETGKVVGIPAKEMFDELQKRYS